MAKLQLWRAASNYAGEEYPDYYVVYRRNRDSTLLDQSNFDTALKMLGGERKPGVKVIRSGHWASGWIDTIMVHKDNPKAVSQAQDIVDSLESYALLDEEDYSKREYKAAVDNIKDAGSPYNLTNKEAASIYRWLEEQGDNVESIDDTGFYPREEQLNRAVQAIRANRNKRRSASRTKSKPQPAGLSGIK